MLKNITYPYKLLLLLCGLTTYLTTNGANLADTSVKKNGTLSTRNSYDIGENLSAFKDAVAAFKQDSVEKGLHLLVTAFRLAESKNKITRMMDYRELEFYNIIDEADNGNSSVKEKQFIEAFIKTVIVRKDESTYKELEAGLKDLPETPFALRLKLFFLSFGNNKQVGKQADRVLKGNPDLLSINTFKAEWPYDNNKYNESILFCNKLIALSPQYAYAYKLRGNNYASLDTPRKAVDDFDKAIKLFPQNIVLHYDRACALMDLDKYSEAIPDLRKMYANNPGYLWTCYNLAKSYHDLNLPDSALYFVNLHITQYPDDGDGYDLKGDVYYGRDDYPEAVELYSQAIKLSPTTETFYEDRGNAFFYGGKYPEALADFQKAVQLDKHRAYANDRLGDCYYQLKEYQKAITFQQQAIKIDPDYKYPYVGLSMDQVELGDYNDAIINCKKAIAIDSTYDTAIGDLGWDYYCAGDNDSCIAYSYKALKYNEKATYAMFNIALATLRKGDAEKAKALYRQFIAECKAKGYVIEDGAIDDLRNLIKKNITVDDCKFIIVQLFEKEI